MPDAYNPWGAPVFPTADDNAMQPETFVPQGVRDWTQQAAPKDYNILSQIAGSLGKALMYPGQVAQSKEPISTEDMVGPAFNLAGMLTLGPGAAPQEANALNMGIKAYHGSPHDFDKFDLSKIGTGEGAQAYGHGLYFADNEGVAKQYRDILAPHQANAAIGNAQKQLSDLQLSMVDEARRRGLPVKDGGAWGDLDAQVPAEIQQAYAPRLQDAQAKVDAAKAADKTGKMYEVNINADPSHFLDWDKPLSQQPHVMQAVPGLKPEWTGGQAYESSKLVPGDFSNKVAASDALRQAGIPGIKYLDQGSRGAGEGSSNYVVFNHDLIDIMRKYAVPGMLGAPILANALSEQKT